jgi:glycerol-3-phosphate dehydrogenase
MVNKLNTEKQDVLIIGGGCSGSGVLLEAYKRGLKCGLIEANDFSSGTSSRSTKLIHGGIRYLQDAFTSWGGQVEKLKLVFEALRERDFLIMSAPFMNNIVEIKFPFSNFLSMCYYLDGIMLYQFMYAIQNIISMNIIFPAPRVYWKDRKVSFFEGQMNDARQNLLTMLSTCKDNDNRKGSTIANYVEFRDYIYDENNKIAGIKAFDKINNKDLNILSQVVINCTGIYADDLFSKNDKLKNKLIASSKGTHLIINKNILKLDSGYMIPKTSDGRILFILPYHSDKYYLVGTTDEAVERSKNPGATQSEVDYIVKEVLNHFDVDEKELRESISSKWSGIRPLVKAPSKNDTTKSIARNHIVRHDEDTGLISLLGGKWTTYRKMGEDVVDKIVEVNRNLKVLPKKDEPFRVVGALYISEEIDEERDFYSQLVKYLSDEYLIKEEYAEDLVKKYGTNAEIIINNIKKSKSGVLSDKLEAELNYCLDYEMVVKPNDFVCRRTGFAFIEMNKASNDIPFVAKHIAKKFKWNDKKMKSEIDEAYENLKYMI